MIIDEAQQYPDLFKTLRGVIDAERKQKGRFLLTGSSSPEVVRGISESLAGRIATVELWPFKQNEFYDLPLPVIYEMISDKTARPRDFLKLRPSLQTGQSLYVWLKGGFPVSFYQNPLKKVQKARKGLFRDQGLLHYFLKITDLDRLLLHPVTGFSFESFVIEEVIRGLQSTMTTQLEFS